VKIVKFEIEHALSLDVRPHEDKIKDHADFKKWAKLNEESIGFSGFCDDKLIGCAGVRTIWDGVGEAWVLASQEVYKHPKSVFKNVRDYLDKIIKEQGFWRVQAHVRTDNSMGIKFAKMLGFKIEGKMQGFNPDKTDAYLFSKVT
jgi:hypothetical protein